MKVTPKKPHFFKPIQPGFKNYIKIPIGFLKYLKGQEQENVVLRRAGKKWLVKFNGHRLEEGWEKFAEEHDLQLGDILVFRHEGNMEFEVVIFDSSHCNRGCAEHLQEEAKAEDEKEEDEEAIRSKEFELKDKPNPCIAPLRKAFLNAESAIHSPFGQFHFACTVRSYCFSDGYLCIPQQFANANGLTNKKCDVIIRDARQRSWNLRLYIACSRVYVGNGWGKFCVANELKVGDHIWFEVVTNGEKPLWKFYGTRDFIRNKPSASGEDDLPHFISTIKPYSINKAVLNLPMDFAKSNGLIDKKREMILKDEVQRSWSVWLGRSGINSFGIICGWKKFRIANGLQEGDAYKFELVKNGKIPIAYFHNLRVSPSFQPEVKKNKLLDDKSISDKGLHFQEQTNLRTKALDASAPNSQVAASIFTDNDANPHFISTIKPYTIRYTVLYLPMAFVKSNDLLSRSEMFLVNEKQRKWCVRLGPKGGHFGIIRGWPWFMKANGVQVGDAYRFELVNNGTIPIAYFHCRYSGKDDKQRRSH